MQKNLASSFLSFHQESYVHQIVPSQCLAQPMAMSLAVVRSWGEQACPSWGRPVGVAWSAWCHSHRFLVSWKIPHFNMFTLDRPTCVRSRLSVFQVVQGFSVPAGRCSSALMLRCTLASRGSSRSLHSTNRAAFAVVLMGLVHVIKLLRNLRRGTTPRYPLSGCLSSVACRVRSVRLHDSIFFMHLLLSNYLQRAAI